MKEELAGQGWGSAPGGGRDFRQLYKKENVKGGIMFVRLVVDAVEAW